MVRNVTGGTGTKSLARKMQSNGNGGGLRVSHDPLEQYACVTKILGGPMVEIYTNDGVRLIGHIRNKFRGRQKRNNIISVKSLVLVGLRSWESIPKNCDILTIYDDGHIEQLKNSPNVNIATVMSYRLTGSGTSSTMGTNESTDFEFSNDAGEEEDDNLTTEKFILENGEEIGMDDI